MAMDKIAPRWTMTTSSDKSDQFVVSFYCPFCGEEETFEIHPRNIEADRINNWVASKLRNHVLGGCEATPQITRVYSAQDDDDFDTSIVLYRASQAGRTLLKDSGGYLYTMSPEEVLGIAAELEDSSTRLRIRAQHLRSLV